MVKKISLYQEVELHTKVAGASPHRLVQLLYESALVHLQLAQQLLIVAEPNKDQLAMLERSLIKVLNIALELRDSLDLTVNSELPHNLDLLYDYIQRRLLHARIKRDVAAVVESISLLETLKSGWDAIGHQAP